MAQYPDRETGWTEERTALLKLYWLLGMSASQIAKKLDGGLTRNAVTGKAWRLGLSGRDQPSEPAVVRPKLEAPKRKPLPPVVAPHLRQATPISVYEGPPGIALEELPRLMTRCRWPLGDPRDTGFSFCGCTKPDDGKPYCEAHERMAYQPRQKGRPSNAQQIASAMRRYG